MGIEIIPIGGYSKIEGNSVAIKVEYFLIYCVV